MPVIELLEPINPLSIVRFFLPRKKRRRKTTLYNDTNTRRPRTQNRFDISLSRSKNSKSYALKRKNLPLYVRSFSRFALSALLSLARNLRRRLPFFNSTLAL
jgi:hypothetical protein